MVEPSEDKNKHREKRQMTESSLPGVAAAAGLCFIPVAHAEQRDDSWTGSYNSYSSLMPQPCNTWEITNNPRKQPVLPSTCCIYSHNGSFGGKHRSRREMYRLTHLARAVATHRTSVRTAQSVPGRDSVSRSATSADMASFQLVKYLQHGAVPQRSHDNTPMCCVTADAAFTCSPSSARGLLPVPDYQLKSKGDKGFAFDLPAVPQNAAKPPALSDAIEAHCQQSAWGQGGVAA
ncbi:unnamed protein product [Pleuronectes platessa]|uniref:Uncharacterized protein n=1 Tax=Pleuronectes platessa TaxID=8262 RepID=A0A9N7U8U3_PLEPL|nr:unnamed protein product [Pleuronectes platessa]